MNIIAKHAGQATVASLDSQYMQRGESDATAAPQFGQLRVFACMQFKPRLTVTSAPSSD